MSRDFITSYEMIYLLLNIIDTMFHYNRNKVSQMIPKT
jgi:hypothetical protein